MRFVLFLIILFILYYSSNKIIKERQWIILLIGNLIFYSWTGYFNFVYILITGISTYLGALFCSQLSQNCKKEIKEKGLNKEEKKLLKTKVLSKKRVILYTTLLLNFGILGYLKYFNEILAWFKIPSFNNLILPLGISFYTFQSIGYLLDVYNEKYIAERNIFKYFHFISFFPQLIQGPINRFDMLKETLYESHSFDIDNIKKALFRVAFGMLKKYAIANTFADTISYVLDSPTEETPGMFIVMGILLYSIQQYADFSGGIDMVLGIAQLFGIKMAENFRQPYFATSLSDFWRRWHISLGAWMRDYVFYPFALTKPMQNFSKIVAKHGGKHLGKTLPACVANILVFFLVGIWHGAQIHYILWGLYNGIIIALSDLFSPIYDRIIGNKINKQNKFYYIIQIVLTFIIVNIGWYFDRIEKYSDIILCFKNTIFKFSLKDFLVFFHTILSGDNQTMGKVTFLGAIIAIIFVFVSSIFKENGKEIYSVIKSRNIIIRWSIYFIIIFLILFSFTYTTINGGFIYANF